MPDIYNPCAARAIDLLHAAYHPRESFDEIIDLTDEFVLSKKGMGIVVKLSPIPYLVHNKRSSLGQIDGQHVTLVKPSSLQPDKPETRV